jgi:hypothetical protein
VDFELGKVDGEVQLVSFDRFENPSRPASLGKPEHSVLSHTLIRKEGLALQAAAVSRATSKL